MLFLLRCFYRHLLHPPLVSGLVFCIPGQINWLIDTATDLALNKYKHVSDMTDDVSYSLVLAHSLVTIACILIKIWSPTSHKNTSFQVCSFQPISSPVALSYVTHMDTICKIIWLLYGVSYGLHPRPHMASMWFSHMPAISLTTLYIYVQMTPICDAIWASM